MPKKSRPNKPRKSLTAEDVLGLIAALPERERYRLGRMLADSSRGDCRLLAGHAVLLAHHFDLMLDLAYHFLRRAVGGERVLEQAMPLLAELRDFAGELLKTRQPKRRPSSKTLAQVEQIRQMRAAGVKWATIDRRLGFTTGRARTLYYKGSRKGW